MLEAELEAAAVTGDEPGFIARHMLLLPRSIPQGLLEHPLAEEYVGIMDVIRDLREVHGIRHVADLPAFACSAHDHAAFDDPPIIKRYAHTVLELSPELSLGNPQLHGFIGMELTLALLLDERISEAWLGVDQWKCLNGEAVA